MYTTTTTAATVPLGTDPAGAPVHWHLTHPEGTPIHGLITGRAGAGGTTALARIGSGARQAGLRVVHVALDGDASGPVQDMAHCREYTTAGLARQLTQVGQAAPDPAVGHVVLLVDGDHALAACPREWARALHNAHQIGVSVVARTHALDQDHLGGTTVREALLHQGQYLLLGRPTSATTHLATAVLPGYTPRPDTPGPGEGVYALAGATHHITVTP